MPPGKLSPRSNIEGCCEPRPTKPFKTRNPASHPDRLACFLRRHGHPIVLRPVSSEDAMTADWTRLPYDLLAKISNRITNEVAGVNRVVLDVTSKPPGTIEWE